MSHISSSEALALLIEGNKRFNSGLRSVETALSAARMQDLAKNGQAPFAIILTCSDSRVPAELLFDRGFGDLFVIRVAGNVVSPTVLASVEYAASVLGSPLCVVMGHSGCGAVSTAVKTEDDQKGVVARSLTPHISKLISAIRPAVREAKLLIEPGNHEAYLAESTRCNVLRSVRLLNQKSSVVADLSSKGQLVTIGAVYDLHSGVVSFESSALHELREKKRASAHMEIGLKKRASV